MTSLLNLALLSFLSITDINHPYLFHHYQNEYDKTYSVDEFNTRFNNFKDNVKEIIINKTTNVETTVHNFDEFIQGGSGNIFTDINNNFITKLGYYDDTEYTSNDIKTGCRNSQNTKLDTV